jgi:hypothetical protein
VIRNVVIHVSNEQPLLADLYGVPTAGDAGLLCTNMRMLDGKRPVFVDRIASTFFFPYLHIRFLEIDPRELQRHAAERGEGLAVAAVADADWATGADADTPMPALAPSAEAGAGEEPEAELDVDLGDIDEDFLQRIRDI